MEKPGLRILAFLFGAHRIFVTTDSSQSHAPDYGEPSGVRLPYVTPWLLKLARLFPGECVWATTTREKVVALTFDDGPSGPGMNDLLDALKRQNLKATFFVLGDRLLDKTSPAGRHRLASLRRAARDGHEIALHGLTHRSHKGHPQKEIQTDIQELRKLIRTELGEGPAKALRFLRPPFGRADKNTFAALRAEGIVAVNASILPGDAFYPGGWAEEPGRSVDRILRELHPGAIICLHVGENLGYDDKVYNIRHAAEIVDLLGPKLKARGYRVELLGHQAGAPVPGSQQATHRP